MRIGIGLNLLAPDHGGVTNYVLTLLRLWPALAPDHPLVLFSFDHNEPLLSTLPAACRASEIRLRTQEEALDHFGRIDLYFCPCGTLWPRPVDKPSVLTFLDIQERFHPEFFTQRDLEERFYHYDWSLRMADAVIAISRFTAESGIRLLGIPRSRFHVVHLLPDELPPPEPPPGWGPADDASRFAYFPANLWLHKNHATLLHGLARLRSSGSDLRLFCSGSLLGRPHDWEAIVDAAGVRDAVRHFGRISRAQVAWLYAHARLVVFPSRFEGFGIPALESMQAGVPFACSAGTSLPEVAGPSALYFDPTSPDAIAGALQRLDADDSLRARLVAAGRARLPVFSPATFINGHLAAFAAARRRHGALSRWLNRRVRLPRSETRRTALSPRERSLAPRLLERFSRLPPGFERATPLPP